MAKTEFEKKKERHASGESTMSADSISGYIPTPPDGGYGWVIVICAFFIHIIVDGIAFTFAIFYNEFLIYFKEGQGKTALVGSLLAGFYLLIGQLLFLPSIPPNPPSSLNSLSSFLSDFSSLRKCFGE